MNSPVEHETERSEPQRGRFQASLIAMTSFIRVFPLFISRRPRTPLRVLCMMSFETVHVLRYSQRMPSRTMNNLALVLDFGASANDFFDKNDFSHQEFETTRRLLEKADFGVSLNEYISRLYDLEIQRPSTGGGERQHHTAQSYRESVIRLSLGMVAATALNNLTISNAIQATHDIEDLELLYRIVMLCQIIDDVLDYKSDIDHRLPGFLTTHTSPAEALTLTSNAAMQYADTSSLSSSSQLFPFRVALWGISALAKVAIIFGHLRLRWYTVRNCVTWLEVKRTTTDIHS